MTGKSERIELRMDSEILDQVDSWRRAQNDMPNRSEAMRRLIQKSLGVSKLQYQLYFFLPGDMHARISDFESAMPPPIQVGELLEASNWNRMEFGDYGPYFRVRSIEHKVIRDIDDLNKVAIFQMGIHLDPLSKNEYSEAAVGKVSNRTAQQRLSTRARALAFHQSRLESFRQCTSDKNSIEYRNEPFFLLHAIPLTAGGFIDPAKAQASAGTLYPSLRAKSFDGRINHLGYLSRTNPDVKAKAHLQVFRTGEIEMLRPIHTMQKKVISGTFSDEEIVHAASSACSTLAGFQIPLPYLLLITLCGLGGYTISNSHNPEIEIEDLSFDPIEISEYDQIAKNGSVEPMAFMLKKSLDVFWNAGGQSQSMTFDDHNWLPAHRPTI